MQRILSFWRAGSRLANPQGQIDLDPGEEGFAQVGQAPVKRVILQPKDAVQWSLYYPGIFSYRDIPLGAAAGLAVGPQPLDNAVAAYDRGDLDGSERDAEEVLARDPENARALLILGWVSLQRQDPQKALAYFEQGRESSVPGRDWPYPGWGWRFTARAMPWAPISS